MLALGRSTGGRSRFIGAIVVAAIAASTASCSAGSAPTQTGTATAPVVWLCRPGLADNPCQKDLTATAVGEDGSTSAQTPAPAPATRPAIDCFYIYPTVSQQQTVNSDLQIEAKETLAARAQASPFSPVCDVYAPMYRSLTSMAVGNYGSITKANGEIAYASIKAAFDEYLAKYNQGRGIVFIGHSQGAWMVEALLKREFDDNATMRRLLVSAIAVGGNVAVPTGKVVGADFGQIPGCTSEGQVGCIVAYSSFNRAPSSDAYFGRVDQRVNPFIDRDSSGDLQILCTNPADLGGGSGVLEPHILTEELSFQGIGQQTGIATPWVTFPQEYSGHCTSAGGATWLQIDLIKGENETRPVIPQINGPHYGMHNVDIAIALGNLVGLVGKQAANYKG
ncbi:MAG TPA: DUF3089 domain-containing protein [Candidatus Limnocylindrales bacterium]